MILRLLKTEQGIIAVYLIAEQGKSFSLYQSIKDMVQEFEFRNYTVVDSSVKQVVFENNPRRECTIHLHKVRRTS